MSIVPAPREPSDDELAAMYTGNPVIDKAERALREFGVHLRTGAKVCLPYWRYADSLTEREFAAVVARFPDHGPSPTADLPPADAPIAYLVAERRGGDWLLGDEWARQCEVLAEAQEVAKSWRLLPGDPRDVAILAVTVVPDGGP